MKLVEDAQLHPQIKPTARRFAPWQHGAGAAAAPQLIVHGVQAAADAASTQDPRGDPDVVGPIDFSWQLRTSAHGGATCSYGVELFQPTTAGLAAAEWLCPTIAWLPAPDGTYASCRLERGG